jgi:rod shape-determining protein MreC
MVADYRYHRLDLLRDYLSMAVYPVQWVVNTPIKLLSGMRQYAVTHHHLVLENKRLNEEHLLQNARLQKLMALESENDHLRSLLKCSPRAGEKLLVAEVIQVDTDPFVHRVMIDKGAEHEVAVGQPVIDGNGVIGEVMEVNQLMSRVILLTDASHGIPVENVRTGARGIAVGTGAMGTLELQHVPNTVDLEVGDILVTSGLDGKYPPGYPVGKINHIVHETGEAFARVQVTPSASLEQSRQFLLLKKMQEGA